MIALKDIGFLKVLIKRRRVRRFRFFASALALKADLQCEDLSIKLCRLRVDIGKRRR
jgi:Tfp pilus assembly protein PilN